jgi:hypothetical protein
MPVDRALDAVLNEIDQIAAATFRSITLSTMLRRVEQQAPGGARRGATAPAK